MMYRLWRKSRGNSGTGAGRSAPRGLASPPSISKLCLFPHYRLSCPQQKGLFFVVGNVALGSLNGDGHGYWPIVNVVPTPTARAAGKVFINNKGKRVGSLLGRHNKGQRLWAAQGGQGFRYPLCIFCAGHLPGHAATWAGLCLSGSFLHPWCLAPCLAPVRFSVNVC